MTDITAAACNRAEQLTELLHRAPTNTDHEGVRAHVRDLADAGLAVMFIRPDSKAPAETRTSRERSAADKVAQAEAKAAGNRNWHRVKSPAGLTLATADTGTLDRYLTNYLAPRPDDVGVNLAIEVGGSRLVVVDADTPEQVAAFLGDSGSDETATVSTPGQRDSARDEFVHHDGGHWYFTVPEGVELPSVSGAVTLGGENGYSVLWDRRYVLIPPSTRTEGAYKATGDVRPLPGWLLDKITAEAGKRAERAAQRQEHAASGEGRVEQWGTGITWAEILSGTNWINTGKPDSCGCDIWTAPGLHGSPKSATAHEPGCGRMDSPDPGLNIWTDHDVEPFDAVVAEHGTYLTRLRAYAAIHHDNDEGAAMTALDLHDDDDLSFDPGVVGDDSEDDRDRRSPEGATTTTLPTCFWESRDTLRQIRDAAWSMLASPDATLAITLARLSASVPPSVRVDTGVRRPMPVHTFAAPVGRSGGFKSSAMEAAEQAVRFVRSWSTDPLSAPDGLLSPADDEPGELAYLALGGTGQGIIENFMGEVPVPLAADAKPNARQRTVRRQVRSNVLVSIDEGNGLAKALADPNSIVGETLRELWSGVTTGQGNAKSENSRSVRRGTYSFGLIVGFQVSVLARLLSAEHVELGTPQRFLFAWTGAPDIPDEPVASPAVLTVTIPADPLTLCPELLARVRGVLLPLLRNAGTDEQADSQRVSVLVRLAALLAILDGRTEVMVPDWELAEVMADTSRAIGHYAVAVKRGKETHARTVRRAEQVADAIAVHTATAGSGEERAAVRIETAIRTEGMDGRRAKWTGTDGIRKAKFDSAEREDADAGLALLVERGAVVKVQVGRTEYVELTG